VADAPEPDPAPVEPEEAIEAFEAIEPGDVIEPGELAPEGYDDILSLPDVRKRAVAGAAVDVMRGSGIRVVGLAGTAVLARLLTPAQFGMIAFGASVTTFAGFLADGGVGTALIRRPEAPEHRDLRALVGFQLAVNTLIALVIALVSIPFGEIGAVTAVMALSLPIAALRAPGFILFERTLQYKPLALVETTETTAYYLFGIATVYIGWGVWGLAIAGVVRTFLGTMLLLVIQPAGRMLPSFSLARVRSLLGFGFRYQAVGFIHLARDQGLNIGIAAISGVSVLGLWSVAYRILQVPNLLFNSLYRVSFPSMSRLVAHKADVEGTLERVVAVVAIGAGIMLAPLVASAPELVPVLLGSRWQDAVTVLPPTCLALMIGAPISVAGIGYLWAIGEVGAPLRAALISIVVVLGVTFPLLPLIGVAATGIGWLVGGILEAVIIAAAVGKHASVHFAPRLIPPTMCAVLGGAAGWLAGKGIGPTFVGAVAAAALAGLVYLAALWLWHRSYLLDAVTLLSQGLRGALGVAERG
jgi:O-antigen/teichoic acid export membrane protein